MQSSTVAAVSRRHRRVSRGWSGVARERPSSYVVGGAGDGSAGVDPASLVPLLEGLVDPGRLERLSDAEVRAQLEVARRLEGAAAVLTARTLQELRRRDSTRGAAAGELLRASGRSGREAAQASRLAGALDAMPGTAAALAEGRLGTEAADALVRAARDATLGAPAEVEAQLLAVAETAGPEELRAEIRRREHAVDGAALLRDERRQHARRRVSLTRRDDGMWDLYGRLAGETGERLRTWLDLHDHPDPPGTDPSRRRRPEQRLADALDTGVTAALDRGGGPSSGGVARPHVTVLVDLATFDTDLTAHDGPDGTDRPVAPDDPVWADLPAGRTEWGGVLSPQAVRRICCDAGVSRVVTAGTSQPLDVGRTTREWPAPMRRAIRTRDGHCRGPDCTRPIGWTEVHHLVWWRHGGTTSVDNGLSLCHACHRLVHDHGWHAVLDPTTGIVTWTSPDRRRTVRTHPRPTR